MFTKQYGGRNNVRKLVVLLTWAEQSESEGFGVAESIAKSMRDEGIAIIVVGIGNLNTTKLMRLSSEGCSYLINIQTLNSKEFIDNMTQVIFDKIGE